MRPLGALIVLLASAGTAFCTSAQATRLTMDVPASVTYAQGLSAAFRVVLDGVPCVISYAELPAKGTLTLTANGLSRHVDLAGAMTDNRGTYWTYTTCENGSMVVTGGADLSAGLLFENYHLVARYQPVDSSAQAATASADVMVTPATQVASATGHGVIRLGIQSGLWANSGGEVGCTVSSVAALKAGEGALPPPPPGVDFRFGAIRFTAGDCGPVTSMALITQGVLLGFDEDLAPGTIAWAYGPTKSDPAPHWYELRTNVAGKYVFFDVLDGAEGDDSLTTSYGNSGDRMIRPTIAVGQPKYSAIPGTFQDLWWGGPAESGWGMTITQHRDVLVSTLFIYDAAGMPRWLIMPGGQWNGGKTAYTGSLYRPNGPGANAVPGYIGSWSPGDPVGSATLTFSSYDSAVLDYTIDGIHGSKSVQRQRLSAAEPSLWHPMDDLWWGGLREAGWGFALTQQIDTFFGVIYTYDARGNPTWLVATWPPFSYSAPLYATSGSPWIGATYDPSKFVVHKVGTVWLEFSYGDSLTMFYELDYGSFARTSLGLDYSAFHSYMRRQPF